MFYRVVGHVGCSVSVLREGVLMTVALFTEDAEEYRSKNRRVKQERDEATEMIQSMRSALIG